MDDLIELNEKFLNRFQKYLSQQFALYSSKICSHIQLNKLIQRTGKLLKNKEWYDSLVIDLSTMSSENIFINTFSNGLDFSTNIKTVSDLDLLYGSIRSYFRKAGFAYGIKYVAGSVYSFQTFDKDDYLWILACISSNEFHNYTDNNSQGTKMPIINWDTFVEYNCPYDKGIIATFNKNNKALFELSLKKMLENRKLLNIKQHLLNKYFTNQL